MASPLTQVARPEVFQPKIVRLYETLFQEDDEILLSEGFWKEFFLYTPDVSSLRRIVHSLAPDEISQRPAVHDLIKRSISCMRAERSPPNEIALETLATFFDVALAKKFTNPSADSIAVIAGLHEADTVMSELTTTLDSVMRTGRSLRLRLYAVRTTLSITAAGFHTALPSYFTHCDLFPALMKYVQDTHQYSDVLPACYLLGLLSNYNKFESHNPYRLRMEDFVNADVVRQILDNFGETCKRLRQAYTSIQDDMSETWSLGSTLNYLGLGALAPGSRPSTPIPGSDDTKLLFAALPGPEIGSVLVIYEFLNANKLFCHTFVATPLDGQLGASPLAYFLSLSSYLFQHAHRSIRSALYTYPCLFILRILVEDPTLMKHLSAVEHKLSVRLCRQRQPYLPSIKADRVPIAFILDLLIDGISHNLKRRLDMDFYILSLGLLLRVISYINRTKTRIAYHWSELWKTLLSFVRFLTTYESDIQGNHRSSTLIDILVKVLALCLSCGDNFLADSTAFDDLFYKIVEASELLTKFKNAFGLTAQNASMHILLSISAHYQSLLETEERGRPHNKVLSSQEVSAVIKGGYESLSIEAIDGLDHYERYREAEFKSLLKRLARAAVEDAKVINNQR